MLVSFVKNEVPIGCMGLLLGFLSCSNGLYFCFCASTVLSWWQEKGRGGRELHTVDQLNWTELKETNEQYTENYKTLKKEVKDDINIWRYIPCSLVGRISIVKMTILPNTIYRYNVILIKLPRALFTELEQKISQFIWKNKRPQIAKAVLGKKNGAGRINLPDLRLYYKATPLTTARQASLSITDSRSLPKLMSIELVRPSNYLILCRPPLHLPSIFPSIRVFSNESALRIRWPKYWSFSVYISSSIEHPGLISFRMDWLDLLSVQGTLKSLLQHHSSKAPILLHSAFFIVHSHIHTWLLEKP